MGTSALRAAKLACSSSDWNLTNLQLQKILYIAHMLYAGRHDGATLITDDQFEAWDYGPVLPKVYRYVSAFGSRPILNVFRSIGDVEDDDAQQIIIAAVEKLSSMHPSRLVKLVHEPVAAWYKHYRPGHRSIVIPQADIEAEYQTRFADRFSHG